MELLKALQGEKKGIIDEFMSLANITGRCPRIAWYPSAGNDFRALAYLTEEYARKYPGTGPEPKEPGMPELFLMTDYDRRVDLADGSQRTLYQDQHTTIQSISSERLPDVQLPMSGKIVTFPEPNGIVMFHYIRVASDTIGLDKVVPVIYVGAVNEEFCAEYLLKYNAEISHVIKIRYGGGAGGGGYASGGWVLSVLNKLNTKVFIYDGREYLQDGDRYAQGRYPELRGRKPSLTPFRVQPREYWSDYGDVSWNIVGPPARPAARPLQKRTVGERIGEQAGGDR